MKKTLIALAVLGVAGVAHAQSNVTIYGIVDVGYVKESGTKVYMDEKVNNRIGFRGVEDLGGGLKATYELEQRFKLHDGSFDEGDRQFEGAANVGLAGGFGAVRFGKMNELSTESYRVLDPFNQYGHAGMFETPLRSARIENSVRYDSPKMGGFSLGASYTLKLEDGDTNNDGFGLSAKYASGPIYAVANYNKAVNSDDAYNWNIGGAYSFGPLKVSLGYEQTKDLDVVFEDSTGAVLGGGADIKEKNVLVGLSYKIGAGTVNASYNHRKISGEGDILDATDKKFALGYTHDLSKRTSVYVDLSHTKLDTDSYYRLSVNDDDAIEASRKKVNAVSVGVTHKF